MAENIYNKAKNVVRFLNLNLYQQKTNSAM